MNKVKEIHNKIQLNLLIHIFIYLNCIILSVSCCTIFEYPDDNPECSQLVEVEVAIRINMELDNDDIIQTYSTLLETGYDIRYIADIYKIATTNSTVTLEKVKRIIQTDSIVIPGNTVILNERYQALPDNYITFVWIDFTLKGKNSDLYYKTDDLTSLSILKPGGQYTGYTVQKDAFSGNSRMDLSEYRGLYNTKYKLECSAKRPFAVYQIVATDVEKYIETYHPSAPDTLVRPATIDLLYELYFPMGYNAQFQTQGNYLSNVGYRFNAVETVPQKEVLLASDYVFLSDETFVLTDFEVKNTRSEHINTVEGLRINLKRNKRTVVRGEFLTKDLKGGNIGVDETFDDEIVVKIN